MLVVDRTTGATFPTDGPASVVTVGTFDGVHRGHQAVIARLVALARERDRRSVVVTFDPHPVAIVRPGSAPPLLTTVAEKIEAMADLGIDALVVQPFTPTLATYSAGRFLDEILVDGLRCATLLVGHDHGFGRDREGTPATLPALGAARGVDVVLAPPIGDDGRAAGAAEPTISSSRIRTALVAGDVTGAAALLGRHYRVAGTVVPGAGRGRDLGARTLNLALPDPRKLLPADGVYAVRTRRDGRWYDGMANLGARPTFAEVERRLEVHGFDIAGDWYGAEVTVAFVAHLRGVERFPDAEALRSQLARDAAAAREALGRDGVPSFVDAPSEGV